MADSSNSDVWSPFKQINGDVFEVYKPVSGCFSLEIVFFHGFQRGDCKDAYYRTWMKGDDSGCWLDTWLVESFPQARILSVTYDSCPTISASTGREDMYLIGEHLAQSLIKLVGVGQDCPVVLVGHCVGGLVLKEMCLRASIFAMQEKILGIHRYQYLNFLRYVKGMFFFATPHLGSPISLRTTPAEAGPLLEYLEPMSAKSARINSDFAKLRQQHGWRTSGVNAANETGIATILPYLDDVTGSHLQMQSFSTSLPFVNEASARMDLDEFCTIPAVDHITICKPYSQSSLVFLLLVNFLEAVFKEEEENEEQLQRSLQCPLKVIQLDDRLGEIIKKLKLHQTGLIRLALVGMDGIGKSTLAKQILIAIQHQFEFTCYLDLEEAANDVKPKYLEKMLAENMWNQNRQKVHLNDRESPWTRLKGRKVLMIVDDVDKEKQIEPFLRPGWCGGESRLIITSSRHHWTPDFIIHSVCTWTEAESQMLFGAHLKSSVLKAIPKELISMVVSQCDGLPLVLEVMGSYLRDKEEATVWKGALKRLQEAGPGCLDGDADGNTVWKKLRVSFETLADLEKRMFLDLASFDYFGPRKRQYDWSILTTAWRERSNEDLIELARMNLVQRSMVKLFVGSTKLIHVQSYKRGLPIRGVYIHSQLRNMGKWISRCLPKDLKLCNETRLCRSVWELEDAKELLVESKGEASRPRTEVLSVAMKRKESSDDSQSQGTSFKIQWRHIVNLVMLRLLRISNMHMLGSDQDLTLPVKLTMLHMESCTRENKIRGLWWWWPGNNCWPIREEDVERLHQLSVLLLENCSPVHLPENFHTLPSLKILQIHDGQIPLKLLPEKFGLLPALEQLSIQNLPLAKLPSSFLQLSSLQSLVLSNLLLETWPIPKTVKESSHLIALRRLELNDLPALSTLPDTFGGMRSLQHLSMKNCSALVELPEGFGGLEKLETLVLQDCPTLEMLCESFCNLRRLRGLHLSDLHALRMLPTTFGNLPSLESMTMIRCTTMEDLPESFVDLQALGSLHINGCDGLVCLWHKHGRRGIGCGLKTLRLLSISSCEKFEYVPESLGQLISLQHLEVTGCGSLVVTNVENFRGLPESLGQILRLRTLHLTNCETLPASLGQLTLLSRLEIGACENFVGLPDSVGRLKSLHFLKIERCQTFTNLPESLGLLSSLRTLILKDCPDLKSLPGAFCQLSSLLLLTIERCKNLVGLPESVGQLSSLTKLQICNCQNVRSLPESLSQLTSLSTLIAESCGYMFKVADCICQMKSLRHLCILDAYSFECMLPKLGQLTQLERLGVSSWNDVSPLLESLQHLKGLQSLLVTCKGGCEGGTRCLLVENFLKSLEKFGSHQHPLKVGRTFWRKTAGANRNSFDFGPDGQMTGDEFHIQLLGCKNSSGPPWYISKYSIDKVLLRKKFAAKEALPRPSTSSSSQAFNLVPSLVL